MKRIDYTSVGEEIFNAITHGVGAVLSIAGMIYLIMKAAGKGNSEMVIAFVVYGLSLFILYLMSTLYHSLTFTRAKGVFRIFDHSSIFLLIAGTYTPIVLSVLSGWSAALFLMGIWAVAIFGVIYKSIWIDKHAILSVLLYIAMGWVSMALVKPMKMNLPSLSIILLIVGGLSYTLGTIFYAMKKVPYMHGVWHFFVLGGSTAHYMAMVYLV
jgi:hemolysin III